MEKVTLARAPASPQREAAADGATPQAELPRREIGAALRALYAPVAERALPIYYGPVLGRLFLTFRR